MKATRQKLKLATETLQRLDDARLEKARGGITITVTVLEGCTATCWTECPTTCWEMFSCARYCAV